MQKDLPGYNIELVKKRIRELQEKYEKEIKPNEADYNEANTKKGFIEPILRSLNWDTENMNEMDAEFPIKNRVSFGSADYVLKINGEIKLLLEAKSFEKDLETGYDIINGQKRTYVEQLIGYAFDLNRHMKTKIDYCILTNGKEWRVYNVRWQGVVFDKKLVFVLKIGEFLDKFVKFWSIEKGNAAKGDIDRYALEEDKLPIDRKAVTSLLYCKKLLIDSIFRDYEKNNRDMKYLINKLINEPVKDAPNGFPKFYEMPENERFNKFVLEASSNIINKILFIRIIEDKGYLQPKLTKKSVDEWKLWFKQADRILSLFRTACHEADELYNGGIFDINLYDELNYDGDVLDRIIGILGDFNFEEIDADVIGRIYEIYLGTVLSVEEEIRGKKRTKLSTDYTERKKLGQYYTPKFVVDFIVKNTLGKLLEGKTPEEVSKIKILDPACGSGSFLIRAFDYLKDYYVGYNDQQMSKIKKNGVGNMNNYIENGEIVDYNHKILRENLHGVDLNDLSVQICSINLWLRALEKDKKLEKLSKNILHGNSLMSGVETKEELTKYKIELKETARLRKKIKEYYGKELNKKEQEDLEGMESKLKELRNKINAPLNENLKKYFENLDLVHPFNWEVEFTEVFDPDKPKEEQGFDVVIGNPPYIRPHKISVNIKKYFWDFFDVFKEKSDIYNCFIQRGIDLVVEKGFISYIVSDTWLSLQSFKELRKYMLDNCRILSLVMLPKKVFQDATVETMIFIMEKNSNLKERSNNIISVVKYNEKENKFEEINEIPQKEFMDDPSYAFTIKWSKVSSDIISKITKEGVVLGDIVNIRNGIATGDDPRFIVKSKEKKEDKKVLYGEDIHRYYFDYGGLYVRYLPEQMIQHRKTARPASSDWFEIPKKILVHQVGGAKIKACLDLDQYFSTISTIIIRPLNKEYDLYFILALLNSKLISYWYKNQSVTSTVKVEELRKIPIPIIKLNRKIKECYNNLLHLSNNIYNLYRSMNTTLTKFVKSINNQPIPDEKACKFAHYWDNSTFYDFSKDTIPFANKTKAKILDMNVREDGEKLIVYTTNISLVQNKRFDNIKTIELTIKNELLRKFLYYSFKKYVHEKKGRGFGSGIILDTINKLPIPVYVANVKQNLDNIKKVMDDFEHETQDLWKINDKTYKSLSEIEEDIEKTDKEIDEMIYELYEITDEEKKVIEESLGSKIN